MRTLLVVACTMMLAGCAALSPYVEQPQVNITSFDIAPQRVGAAPRFLIGVQVVNPNRAGLPLRGMSYSVEIDRTRVLSGAIADLPTIPAYGSADFVIEATPDLLGSARVIAELASGRSESVGYTFRARLDVGGLMPNINIEQSGRIGQ